MMMVITKGVAVCVVLIFFESVASHCSENRDNKVICGSQSVLSGFFINETLEHAESVTSFEVYNAGGALDLGSNTFEKMVNLKNVIVRMSNLTTIYAGTFKNLPLTRVDLSYNEIEKIAPMTFLNLNKIQKIQLRYNKIKAIKKNVFVDMPVVTLTLSHNSISQIEDDALKNMTSLKKLHLDDNKLSSIYPHKFLSNPEVLEILWLHNNSLKFLTANMLLRLKNLRLLNLGFNKIDSIEENAFTETPNLDTLVLSHNNLKEVDGRIFPRTGMRSLERLYLDSNKLMYLSSNFFFKLVSLQRITLVDNPWLCNCLDAIHRLLMENSVVEKCNEAFINGKRPLCVADKVEGCRYKYDQDLAEVFYRYGEENPVYVRTIDCIL